MFSESNNNTPTMTLPGSVRDLDNNTENNNNNADGTTSPSSSAFHVVSPRSTKEGKKKYLLFHFIKLE